MLLQGTLHQPAKKVEKHSYSEVWKGHIKPDHGGPLVDVHIKIIPENQAASEIVCALAGRAINLPIPRPWLIRAPKCNLPGATGFKDDEVGRWLVAAETLPHPDFSTWILDNQHDDPFAIIGKWESLMTAALFDEWIANGDRRFDNLKFDGRTFHLFDHGHAMTGPNWEPPLNPHSITDNWLFSIADRTLRPAKRKMWATNAGGFSRHLLKVDLNSFREKRFPLTEDALEFMHQRIAQLKPMIDRRLGQTNLAV